MPRIKHDPWPRRAQSSRKDTVSKINYDPTEHTQQEYRRKRRKQLTLLGELGKGHGPTTRSRKVDRSLSIWKSEHRYTWGIYRFWLEEIESYFNIHANKVLEGQMLSTSKSLWEKFTLSDPKEGYQSTFGIPSALPHCPVRNLSAPSPAMI